MGTQAKVLCSILRGEHRCQRKAATYGFGHSHNVRHNPEVLVAKKRA